MKKLSAFLLFAMMGQLVLAEMTCDINADGYYALYEPDLYTCSSGQFLPANSVSCSACPSGLTCTGGTYSFNSDKVQGVDLSLLPTTAMNGVCAYNFPVVLYAMYEPNEYTCVAGTYLAANHDGCETCLANSYCAGGTFTFNENTSQGIEPCAVGYSAPAGSDAASDCTGNIITIIWAGASAEDIAENNAGTVTYGGDIRTPKHAPHINGKIFTGWTFNEPQ